MSPVCDYYHHQSNIHDLEQRRPHFSLPDSCPYAARDTGADTVMPPIVSPSVAANGDDQTNNADDLHLPAIPSAVASPSKKPSVDASKTGSHGSSSTVLGELTSTTTTTMSLSSYRRFSGYDPQHLPTASVATNPSDCCQPISNNAVAFNVFKCGLENSVTGCSYGPNKSREPIRRGWLPSDCFVDDGVDQRSPRAAVPTRDRRRQSRLRVCHDDERVMRSRLTRFNRTVSFGNLSKSSAAFGTVEYGKGSAMRNTDDVSARARFCHGCYPSEISAGRTVVTRTAAAVGNGKRRSSSPSQSHAVDGTAVCLPQTTSTARQRYVRFSDQPTTSVRRRDLESIDAQRRTGRNRVKQTFGGAGRLSATVDGDDDTGDREQKQRRIIDWLDGVGVDVERPPSPNIEESPTPTQTDTAIHIVYSGD